MTYSKDYMLFIEKVFLKEITVIALSIGFAMCQVFENQL